MVPGAIDFAIERQRHAEFVGRTELLALLDRLLLEEQRDRWVLVTSGPGMGKSALLTAWLARREAAGDAVPHHFIRRGYAKWDDPATLVSSLVAQVDTRSPEQREPEADTGRAPAERLAAALVRVSQCQLVPRRERLVLLIDALDEFDAPAGSLIGDPLAAFLPYALPRGVSVLCASRPRHPYVDALGTRGALVQIDLDDEPNVADNTATVRAYWEHVAPVLGLDARFVDQAVERAGGNLQHAVTLRHRLEGLAPAQRRVEDIPRGLSSLIERAWDRISIDPPVASGLGILCAARESLSLDELGRVAAWSGAPERKTFVRGARELLIESRRPGDVPEYRLQHDAIRAHIADAVGTDALAECHRALAHKLAKWPPGQDAARRYALRHALLHRAEAGEWADAWRVASDMSFLEAKCRDLGAGDAEADISRTADRCRASTGGALGKRFDDLVRALSRESHWLHTAPDATAALVWNRLRLLGWEADEIDGQLRIPEAVEFLRVRHAATRESPALVRDLAGHNDSVNACAVTPDGRYVVSASDDHTLKVWELASGRAAATLQDHPDLVTACVVTPDGRHVVSASEDKTLKVWELGSGRAVTTLQGHTSLVTACAVTPDGRHVVSASFDKTLKIWELASRRAVATLAGHTDSVTACTVTPDGRHVISASFDKTLKIWELRSGRAVTTLQGHSRWVSACAVTPDGRYVVSASYDHTLKVWELASGRLVTTLQGHSRSATACTVTPDGRHIVSGSDDHTLKVWELASGLEVSTLQAHTGWVGACAVTPDGRHVISASKDKTLKVWELASGRTVATRPGHILSVTACAMTPDGRHAVSASEDKTLKVWELASGRGVATLRGHTDGVSGCVVTPDGRYVVSAARDKTLRVWEFATAREVVTLQGHTSWVHACAVTPNGQHAISASEDKTLKVWELASGRVVATLQGDTYGVTACAVTPDGRYLVSGSYDQTLKVWELARGRAVATLQGHTGPVTACTVTPNGQYAVSASHDTSLIVWELARGRAVATLRGHTDWVTACAVTPDGRYVVSASEDRTLKMWDLPVGTCLVTHRGTGRYTAIAATPSAVIAGDAAGGIWFLDVPRRYRRAIPSTEMPEQQESNGKETAYMSNPERREGTEFPATAVFVAIHGLKDCTDAPKIPSALRSLNEALRHVQPGAFVLSTIVGVIVIVPDAERWSPDDLYRTLDQAKIGFALRVGVTHGTVEVVRDIDDKPNVIGPPINIAARLASSSNNPGILIDESYADFVDDVLAASHWLHRSVRTRLSISGKPQDPLFTCFPGPYRFEAKPLPPQHEDAVARPAVLIAYDLPKFSAGDRVQLVKRFKGLANVFQKLRQSALMRVGSALLSPGGDGGVLVLEAVDLNDAASIAARLQSLTEIESLDRDGAIAVDIRIGVHYGQVVHYVNARGIERPTGLAVFAADEIAGDEAARSRHGVILTRLVARQTAGGSDERLASEFERLPKLASGPASGIERFRKADPRRGRLVEASQESKPTTAPGSGSHYFGDPEGHRRD